jgi:hypothetical protein
MNLFWGVICQYLQVRLLRQILQFLECCKTCFQWLLVRYISFYLSPLFVLYGLAYINFCLPVFLLLKMQQFNALPMMPIQAMTQQVEKDFSVIFWFIFFFPFSIIGIILRTSLMCEIYTGYSTCQACVCWWTPTYSQWAGTGL